MPDHYTARDHHDDEILQNTYQQDLSGLSTEKRQRQMNVTGVLLDGALRALVPKYLAALRDRGAFSDRLRRGQRHAYEFADYIFGFMATYNAFGPLHAAAHDDEDDHLIPELGLETCGMFMLVRSHEDGSSQPSSITAMHRSISIHAAKIVSAEEMPSIPPTHVQRGDTAVNAVGYSCVEDGAMALKLAPFRRNSGYASFLSPKQRAEQQLLAPAERTRLTISLAMGCIMFPTGPHDKKHTTIDCSLALFRLTTDAFGDMRLFNAPHDESGIREMRLHWLPFAPSGSKQSGASVVGEDSYVVPA